MVIFNSYVRLPEGTRYLWNPIHDAGSLTLGGNKLLPLGGATGLPFKVALEKLDMAAR